MKTFPAEILSISAIELSRRLHSREVTAVELMKATLARIDDVNPKVRAIVALRKGMWYGGLFVALVCRYM